MNKFKSIYLLLFMLCIPFQSAFSLEQADRSAILDIIERYTDSWNNQGGKGFGADFTEDADWVNIFGMKFVGKAEIEERHVKIINTIFKDSKLEILDTSLREVYPGLVIGLVHWRLHGFRNPGTDLSKPGEVREGIFSHVFINLGNHWEVTATQNTLIANRV